MAPDIAPTPARQRRRTALALATVAGLALALAPALYFAFGTPRPVTVPTAAGGSWTVWPGEGASADDARQAGELLAQTFLIQARGESLARLTLTDRGCFLSMYLDPGEIDLPGTEARAVILRTRLGERFGVPAVVELCAGPGRPGSAGTDYRGST